MAKTSNEVNLVDDSAMLEAATALRDKVVEFAPYQKIKDSVYISRISGKSGKTETRNITVAINMNPVTGGAPFARAFDSGSGIHGKFKKKYPIVPVRGRFLQFAGTKKFSGKIIRTTKVMHPGVKGTDYIDRAIKASRPEIRADLKQSVGSKLRLYLRKEFAELGKK